MKDVSEWTRVESPAFVQLNKLFCDYEFGK